MQAQAMVMLLAVLRLRLLVFSSSKMPSGSILREKYLKINLW